VATDTLERSAHLLADELLFSVPGSDDLQAAEDEGHRAERLGRFAAAMQVKARVAQWRQHEAMDQLEWAAESVALVEECSPRAAADRLIWSVSLYEHLPVTWSLLREGEIPLASARVIAEQGFLLDHAQCRELEERLWPDEEDTLPSATGKLPAALRSRCQHWIPRIVGGDTTEVQTTAARQDRDVYLTAGDPGTDMALLHAPLTVPDAEAIMAALNATADAAGPDDPRSRGVLRADALVEAITGQPSFALWADSGMTDPLPIAKHWTVQVTVGLDVLAGTSTDPGVINRTPVTSPTARLLAQQAIAAGGRIARLVTDPLSGALLDVTIQNQHRPPSGAPPGPPPVGPLPDDPPPSGPRPASPPGSPSCSSLLSPETTATVGAAMTSTEPSIGSRTEAQYQPSEALARFVRARDRRCQHPGCGMPASRCDLDHITPWPAGPTTADNLVALCRHHHRLKHSPDWTLTKTPNGSLEWTTPSKRIFRVEPPDPLGLNLRPLRWAG
jgi:hypothetical protein